MKQLAGCTKRMGRQENSNEGGKVTVRFLLAGSEERARYLQQYASSGVTVDAREPGGPSTIESMADEYAYIPGLLRVCRWAEDNGYDAIITGCFGDPGIDAARELVSIPVMAPAETSMLVAMMLGDKFSVVTPLESTLVPLRKQIRVAGIESRVASIRVLGERIMAIRTEKERVLAKAVETCQRAVDEDGADVIIMGCGSLSFYAKEISERVGVPVINPLVTALRAAEMLVGAGLRHSKKAYPFPPKVPSFDCC